MSDLKDDWLDYDGLADLAAEEQLSAAPEGAEDRVYGRLMAAVGLPVTGGGLEALDAGQVAAQGADVAHGVSELASVGLSQAVNAGGVVTTGSAVGGGATVGAGALGAKGLALLLTIAGGGAAITMGVDDEGTSVSPPAITAVSPQRTTTTAPAVTSAQPPALEPTVPPQAAPSEVTRPRLAAAVQPTTDPERRAAATPHREEAPRPARTVKRAKVERPAASTGAKRARAQVVTGSAPSVVPRRDAALLAEQTLLRGARRAIAKRDFSGALISVRHHEISHPKGRLTEERELLRVQALALAGRLEEAERAAHRFRSRFPASLMLPALEYALKPDAGVR